MSFLWADRDNNLCLACPPLCSTCLDQSNCLTCQPQAVLGTDGTCQLTCQWDEYLEAATCVPCHPDCATCSGPGENQCLECGEGRVLKERTCVGKWTCPQAFFVKEESQECVP